MPNQPNERYQQDTGHLWREPESTGRLPAQPPYHRVRTSRGPNAALSWHELNKLPAGRSAPGGLPRAS
ncbi:MULTISPECIES: hypothetical protein [Micromonospora]|uniref:hypothetical protein n=1 Tax=Micromonospora TaxID=1873 RepID=UPI000B818E29|nr:hypothetical protein [Micromonospora yangpuensis]GGL87814.1 hypothetical protein GCM10012279_01840 [Micromonospora yangpuensis]